MNDFPQIQNALLNIGGVQQFQFAPVSDIASIPAPYNNVILSPVIFKQGKKWLNGYSTYSSLAISESSKEGKDGSSTAITLPGRYPKLNKDVHSFFETLAGGRYVVLVKDANGTSHLMGTVNNGCRFSFSANSGGNAAQSNEYSFSFYVESETLAPIYAP